MISVFHLTSSDKSNILSVLNNLLSSSYSTVSLSSQKLCLNRSCDYLLCCSPIVKEISGNNTIIILDTVPENCKPINIDGNIVAAVSSYHVQAMLLASQSHFPTVTCGMGAGDTVTLSSSTCDSAVICLQRTIYTLSGDKLEPVEIPITLSGKLSHDEILLIAAVLFISGNSTLLKNASL
ncbi:MAG: hypothetical protein RR205_00135 [Oscillospiraceae bacterium]